MAATDVTETDVMHGVTHRGLVPGGHERAEPDDELGHQSEVSRKVTHTDVIHGVTHPSLVPLDGHERAETDELRSAFLGRKDLASP